MPLQLRTAQTGDAAGVLSIYAPVVRDTAISFELEPPDEAAMASRIRETLRRWPWLVCADDGGNRPPILGYAYATAHRERAAYRWCVEVSVYVHPGARRLGVARALYTALFGLLRQQGFVNAYAGITLPNAASVGVHEALGFRPVGVYHAIGFKQGRWHDVGWWELALQPQSASPAEPRTYAEILGDTGPAAGPAAGHDTGLAAGHAAALAAGAALLRR